MASDGFTLRSMSLRRYTIMETLAAEDFRPKRYEELRKEVEGEIRSERTLWLYLKKMENEGLVSRKKLSHKRVLYDIPERHKEEWAFLAEPNPFGRHLSFGVHMELVMRFVLDSLGDKRIGMSLALRYAFASFFSTRTQFAPARIFSADSEKIALAIERESSWYTIFLRFIMTFLNENRRAARDWLRASSNTGQPAKGVRKLSVSTPYVLQDALNGEFEILRRVIELDGTPATKALDLSRAARQIGLKLYKDYLKTNALVRPMNNIYEIFALRDDIQRKVVPLVGNQKISRRKLSSLYKKATGRMLSSAALSQALQATSEYSPLRRVLKRPP
jgi:hypothetical protein